MGLCQALLRYLAWEIMEEPMYGIPNKVVGACMEPGAALKIPTTQATNVMLVAWKVSLLISDGSISWVSSVL